MHGEFLGNFLIQHLVTLVPTQIPHNRILLYPGRQLRIVLGDLVSINISPNAWRIFGQHLEKLGNFLIQHLVTLLGCEQSMEVQLSHLKHSDCLC